nr:restriction endonuclease subunit S [Psychromicrobium silvestre]
MTSLGSVTSWLSGGTPNRSNTSYWSGDIPWISATTLKKLEAATSDQLVTPAAVKAGSKMAPLGSTLLLVRGSALHSEIRASLVTGTVCFNQDVKALVPSRNLVPKFLTYSIHGNADRLLRLVTSAGNTAGVLDTQVVKNFQIWMPDRSEQQRLVTLLDDISSEIDVLVSRLVKVTAAKQGMMQELLTGRTRLQSAEVTP